LLNPINIKICLLGNYNAGKTTAFSRFGEVIREDILIKSSISISKRVFVWNNQEYRFLLWDIIGDGMRFVFLRKIQFIDVSCAIFLYDITSDDPFDGLFKQELDFFKDCALFPNEKLGFLVGNKSDLFESRKITMDVVKDYSSKFQLQYLGEFSFLYATDSEYNAFFNPILQRICYCVDEFMKNWTPQNFINRVQLNRMISSLDFQHPDFLANIEIFNSAFAQIKNNSQKKYSEYINSLKL
jgi:GTPase SAR1 family protein